MISTRWLLPTLAIIASATAAFAHEVESDMLGAAKNFIASLSPEQRQKASFGLDDAERKNWHFIPRTRLGLTLKEMTPVQRLVAQALLASGMSSRGYSKATTIMSLEAFLAELEKGQTGKPVRDPEMYFFSIFGTPSADKPWAWRVEGHHLSLNFTCSGHGASATPSFYGANPGMVRQGLGAGFRVLGREEDLGRQLVTSLSVEQKKIALISTEPPTGILNDPNRANYTSPEGLSVGELTSPQKAILEEIVREYLGRNRPEIEASEWARIQASDWNSVKFAWAGGIEPGQGHYYRIQGQSFIMEYDNTQNKANHPHAAWRDTERDFGTDLLKEHYAKNHAK